MLVDEKLMLIRANSPPPVHSPSPVGNFVQMVVEQLLGTYFRQILEAPSKNIFLHGRYAYAIM